MPVMDVSRCPLNITRGPSPSPRMTPTALARFGPISWSVTSSPPRSMCSATNVAASRSAPVRLEVLAHQALGLGAVAGAQRGEDPRVLLPGLLQTGHCGRPQHADAMDLVLHVHQEAGQALVARARVERGMEPGARPQRALGRAALGTGPLRAHQALQLLELILFDPLGGDARAHALERHSDLVDLKDVFDARLRDEAPALRDHLDEAFRLEPPERLP